jgi:glycosyltransferase involved in cell wall biosynthesis
MRIAFYAPLKPPTHPVPSGDRRMARLLMRAFESAGHQVEVAALFRSLEPRGDSERQTRLAGIGGRLAARLARRWLAHPAQERPRVFVTYHLYYKAPDWIGPRVAARLGIPYVVVEASVANKRAGGPWSLGHEATVAALKRAAAVVSLNPADDAGVLPHLAGSERLHHLRPFLDGADGAAAAGVRGANHVVVGQRFDLPADEPWLVAVAMMRPGDKLASYRLLGEALAPLRDRPWRLLVVGDGSAREDVRAALAPLGERVRYAGMLDESELPAIYAASDLFVWPAINEAYGMALLEAQAAGLPVVAGDFGGVSGIVAHGRTGWLTARGEAGPITRAVADLLADPARRKEMSRAAIAKTAAEHSLAAAGRALDTLLAQVTRAEVAAP